LSLLILGLRNIFIFIVSTGPSQTIFYTILLWSFIITRFCSIKLSKPSKIMFNNPKPSQNWIINLNSNLLPPHLLSLLTLFYLLIHSCLFKQFFILLFIILISIKLHHETFLRIFIFPINKFFLNIIYFG